MTMRLHNASCSILKHKRWWWAGEIDSWSLNWWPSYYYVYIFGCYVKDHQNIWLLPQEIALHFLFKDHDSSISLHLDGSKPVRSAYFYSLRRENSQGYDTLDKDYYIYRWTEHSADYFWNNDHWGGENANPNYTRVDFLDHDFLKS